MDHQRSSRAKNAADPPLAESDDDGSDPEARMTDETPPIEPGEAEVDERRRDLRTLWARHGMAIGIVGGGHASGLLIQEAIGCYVHGFFAAALICAHASCERELAGRVAALVSPPPQGSERWGLGRLLGFANQQQWFSATAIEKMGRLNDNRRDLYHFRDGDPMGDLFRRTYQATTWKGKHHIREDMQATLRRDALNGLDAALTARSETSA